MGKKSKKGSRNNNNNKKRTASGKATKKTTAAAAAATIEIQDKLTTETILRQNQENANVPTTTTTTTNPTAKETEVPQQAVTKPTTTEEAVVTEAAPQPTNVESLVHKMDGDNVKGADLDLLVDALTKNDETTTTEITHTTTMPDMISPVKIHELSSEPKEDTNKSAEEPKTKEQPSPEPVDTSNEEEETAPTVNVVTDPSPTSVAMDPPTTPPKKKDIWQTNIRNAVNDQPAVLDVTPAKKYALDTPNAKEITEGSQQECGCIVM